MEQNASLMWDLDCVSDMVFAERMKYFWASIYSSPLFSSIITLYALILLYFPCHFLSFVFSPVVIITGILLITLLRLGASQSFEEDDKHKEKVKPSDPELETEYSEPNDTAEIVHEQIASAPQEDHSFVTYQFETEESDMGFDQYPCFDDYFVEWNVKAPLEVIYEEYEGEEDEVDPNENPNCNREEQEKQVLGLGRQPSLSLYYPESDSDTSSDGDFSLTGAWDSPGNMCYKWADDDKEGLIEIALDGNKRSGLQFQVEEDNLIEIDISPTRSNDFGGEKWLFSGEVRFS